MKLYTCRIFIQDMPTRTYRNVDDLGLHRLKKMLKESVPGAKYFNVYEKKTDIYVRRIYIN